MNGYIRTAKFLGLLDWKAGAISRSTWYFDQQKAQDDEAAKQIFLRATRNCHERRANQKRAGALIKGVRKNRATWLRFVKNIKVRTLLICGEEDNLIKCDTSQGLCEDFQEGGVECKEIQIPEARHAVQREKADEVSRLISAFVGAD